MSIKDLVKNALIAREDRAYEKRLAERTMSYSEWIGQREAAIPERDEAQSKTRIDGDYVLFAGACGRLAPCALWQIEHFLAEHPEVQLLYGDEDAAAGAERTAPWFKPDWSPDLLDYAFYFGSTLVVRKDLLAADEEGQKYLALSSTEETKARGYIMTDTFDEGYRAFVRRLAHICGGYRQGADSIGHVQGILFSCDSEETIKRYMEEPDSVKTELTAPAFSVIIPSKDHAELLAFCLESLDKACENARFEVIIVDNGSDEANRQAIAAMAAAYPHPVRYLYEPMEFNFSKMCNRGALAAKTDVLVFLNDDVEVVTETHLPMLASLASRDYTGEVGVKLFYPGSDKIQHAGITSLPSGPVHKMQFLSDSEEHYFRANRGTRNVTAATAALIVIEKKKFYEAGGFPEELKVAFNDVALGYALCERGYFNVCDNEAYAYHHESLSRGNDGASEEKVKRLLGELEVLRKRHPEFSRRDPYFNDLLARDSSAVRIRPAFVTARNVPQEMNYMPERIDVSGYRMDPCLMVNVEEFRDGFLKGYAVVLGDDNACYRKEVLLYREDRVYAYPVEGQYRPDLTDNLPDQKNVGLCGFCFKLPEDASLLREVKVGAAAVNRVTGLKLYELTQVSMHG